MSRITIIGERINSTGEKVRSMLESRDGEALLSIAGAQVEAGADFLDLNASMLMDGEEEILRWLIGLIGGRLDTGLSIDSPDIDLLLRLAREAGERCILNSLTCDQDVLDEALPVVEETGVRAIVMLKSRKGIPPNARERLDLARRARIAMDARTLDPEQIMFDPVFSPLATSPSGLGVVLETISELRREYPDQHRVGGLSNISFGMPLRRLLHRTFLVMAVSHGLSAVICDPTDGQLLGALRAAEALGGLDSGSKGFLQYYRSSRER